MTKRRILIIQGHPDPLPSRLCRNLAKRYAAAAELAGHEVRVIDVATLEFSLIRSSAQFYDRDVPPAVGAAQTDLEWCDHVALFFPVWLGAMPAVLKGFFEQLFRPWFTLPEDGVVGRDRPRLGGRSLRMVVTMGMPALIYSVIFGAQGLNAFSRNLKMFTGVGPARKTLIGNTEREPQGIERKLRLMDALGARGR